MAFLLKLRYSVVAKTGTIVTWWRRQLRAVWSKHLSSLSHWMLFLCCIVTFSTHIHTVSLPAPQVWWWSICPVILRGMTRTSVILMTGLWPDWDLFAPPSAEAVTEVDLAMKLGVNRPGSFIQAGLRYWGQWVRSPRDGNENVGSRALLAWRMKHELQCGFCEPSKA